MSNPQEPASPGGQPSPATDKSGAFATTHWSVVLAAGNGDVARSAAALEKLCRQYWHPVFMFVRRRGADRHEAEDLTQAFFAHLLDKESLKKVDPQKGKFRTFLLTALTNFLVNEWDKRHTLKRGGQFQIMPLHEVPEEWFGRASESAATPEKLFDRQWALLLVEVVRTRLKVEYAAQDKAELFAKLSPALTGEQSAGWPAGVAAELNMSEGSVRVALHRLRRRFGDLLRDEVSRTVSSNAEVDEDIRHLFAAMSQ